MSLRDRLAESPASRAIDWHSADASTHVHIPLEVVDHIAGLVVEAYKAVPRRGAESGGALLGQVRLSTSTTFSITGVQPIACEHRLGPSFVLSTADDKQFRSLLANRPASSVVGYYRSHTRKEPGLDNSDREMVERLFPGRSGIVLLINPSMPAALTAEIYFFQNGRLDLDSAGPEFAFQGTVPGGILPQNTPLAVAVAPVQEPLVFPSDPAYQEQGDPPTPAAGRARPPRNLHWEIFAAAVMIAAALGLLYWQYHGDAGDPIAVTPAVSAPAQVSSLGLAVQTGEGGWRVTWNPNTPEVRDALGGALNVIDENSRERIPLTVSEIRSGSATYRPTGNDVTFRLELTSNNHSIAAETYRIIQKDTVSSTRLQPAPPKRKPAPVEKAEPPEPQEPLTPPEVVHRVSPEIGEGIRPRISSPTPIDVRVHIDRQGRVTSAIAIQHGDGLIGYLADRAVAAAKLWTFTPAKQGEKPVGSTRIIHFVFEQ